MPARACRCIYFGLLWRKGLGVPNVGNGYITIAFSGSQPLSMGIRIRSGYLTPAASGAHKRGNGYITPAFSGGPQRSSQMGHSQCLKMNTSHPPLTLDEGLTEWLVRGIGQVGRHAG